MEIGSDRRMIPYAGVLDGNDLKVVLGGAVTPTYFICQRMRLLAEESRSLAAVGLAAVFYSQHQDGVAEVVEADAIVAGAETELWRLDVL